MRNKTTEGIWHVDGFNLTAVISEQNSETNHPSYKHICDCNYGFTNPEKHFEENKANAKLISASPELLHNLQRLIEHFTPFVQTQFEENLIFECNEVVKKATKI